MIDWAAASLTNSDVLTRARKIKLFLMDVDGTLTDGGVCLIGSLVMETHDAPSVTEMKVFNAQDGPRSFPSSHNGDSHRFHHGEAVSRG